MFGRIKKLENYIGALERGAALVDVRTEAEFAQGHHPQSINLPLQHLAEWAPRYQPGDEVVVVCRSGSRSGMAALQLRKRGVHAVNGGPWNRLT
ncbi:MAG: rhodanese-like domain-containing protein [Flavobacteriales bacterium]